MSEQLQKTNQQGLLYREHGETSVDSRFRIRDDTSIPERQTSAVRDARPIALLLFGIAQEGRA